LASILPTGRDGQAPRVLLITSPAPGEGKTTVSSNLAIALAETGRRVLLIDADLRRPSLHEIFALPNVWGLSSLLKRSKPVTECPFASIAQETAVPGLFVVPSGPPPSTGTSQLLHSCRVVELLGRLRTEFDSILIDTPPMLQIADARVLAPLADGVLLVLRAGQTPRETARAAINRLLGDHASLLGVVLNGWDPKANGYGCYDRGDYRYVARARPQRKEGRLPRYSPPVGLLKPY
jgi:capsular exopolysaccharide synthesis family protein